MTFDEWANLEGRWLTPELIKPMRLAWEAGQAELKAENEKLQEDKMFLDWLGTHPRYAEIFLDGERKECVLYGVSCSDMKPIREILRVVIAQFKEGKES